MTEIILDQVSLTYPVYGTRARSLKMSLLQAATGGKLLKKERKAEVLALEDISFHLQSGDRLGLIGHNGAGKTSLLKILAKIYQPTSGRLTLSGKLNSLFNIMVGMDHGLTGYENIFLRGLILGLKKADIRRLTPHIEAFADLGEFMQMPLNTYSAGMLVRLGFAIMTSIPSDILLIDEIFNAGDAPFLEKAKNKIGDLVHQSHILVLSTHDHETLRRFCNKILCLEHGKITYFGSINDCFFFNG